LRRHYPDKPFSYLCDSEYESGTRRSRDEICDAKFLAKDNQVGSYVAEYTAKKSLAGDFPHRAPEKPIYSK